MSYLQTHGAARRFVRVLRRWRSTSITSWRSRPADDILDMSEGFVGRVQYLIGYNSVQLTPRTGAGFYRDGPRGHRERRLQRLGLRQRLQPAAVHDPARRERHAHRLRRRDLRRLGRWLRHDASPRHGRLLHQQRVRALPDRRHLAARCGDLPARQQAPRSPDLTTSDLIVRNDYFAETPLLFQANTATPASQFSLDAAGNSLDAQHRRCGSAVRRRSRRRARCRAASRASTSRRRPARRSPRAV